MLTSLALLLAMTTHLASERPTPFRESAAQILVEKGLRQSESGAFVCVSIDGKPPADAELAKYRALGIRPVGKPSDCLCSQNEDGPAEYECLRVGTREPACIVTVFDFELREPNDATATLLVSCGWPRGGGEKARFEKKGENWIYLESASRIQF